MATNLKEIENSALNLSKKDKVRLVDKLLQSIHGKIEPEIEQAWSEEVDRRNQRLEMGEAELVGEDDVMKKARSILS